MFRLALSAKLILICTPSNSLCGENKSKTKGKAISGLAFLFKKKESLPPGEEATGWEREATGKGFPETI